MTIPFVVSVVVLLGLLFFLIQELRRSPGPREWGRTPRWKKTIRVCLRSESDHPRGTSRVGIILRMRRTCPAVLLGEIVQASGSGGLSPVNQTLPSGRVCSLTQRPGKRTIRLARARIKPSALTLFLALMLVSTSILACKSAVWRARVLADKQDHPSKIISDGDSVFYVTGGTLASQNEGTNNVNRISLKDGRVSVLVKGGEHFPSQTLAGDETFLYWSEPGKIYRVPKAGGASEMIVSRSPSRSRTAVSRYLAASARWP